MMFNRLFKFFSIFIILSALIYHHLFLNKQDTYSTNISVQVLASVFPSELNIIRSVYHSDFPPYFEVFAFDNITRKEFLAGYAFLSQDIVPEERGYEGPIQVLIAVDTYGAITGINILKHRETTSYAKQINDQAFKQQFLGKNVSDYIRLGRDIDGITGATVSSACVVNSIRKSIGIFSEKVLNAKKKEDVENIVITGKFLLKTALFILLIILAHLDFFVRFKRFRMWILLVTVIYFGFFVKEFFSLVQIASVLRLNLPILSQNLFWYIYIIGILLIALVSGRIYCGYLCPFGALSEILYMILPKIKIIPSKRVDYFLKYLKYIILFVLLFTILTIGEFSPLRYEPFAAIFTFSGSFSDWFFVAFVLIASIFISRFWCRYFCPSGALLGVISQHSFFRLKMNAAGADSLHKFNGICKVSCFKDKGLDNGECVRCGKCLKIFQNNKVYIDSYGKYDK